MLTLPVEAVAFDCYGTLIDFGDRAFAEAYGLICREQGIEIDGQRFYDKWMDIWRRLAQDGSASDGGSVGVIAATVSLNQPGPLSEAEDAHPDHHTPSAGRDRAIDGPRPSYRPYSEEWPEHFALCFAELGVSGDARAAHGRLVDLLSSAPAFPEARRVSETISRRMATAVLSNADDDFLHPCLSKNGLVFPIIVSSQSSRSYKPHPSIFEDLVLQLGVPAGRVLYVGDSRLADVVGAKNAGLRTAWVNRPTAVNRPIEGLPGSRNGELLRRFPPDFELDSLDGLLDILGLR